MWAHRNLAGRCARQPRKSSAAAHSSRLDHGSGKDRGRGFAVDDMPQVLKLVATCALSKQKLLLNMRLRRRREAAGVFHTHQIHTQHGDVPAASRQQQ